MATGVVKWFDTKKGYGFIVDDDTGNDVFVHFTGIKGTGQRNLAEGETVEFTSVETPRGNQAQDVRKIV